MAHYKDKQSGRIFAILIKKCLDRINESDE